MTNKDVIELLKQRRKGYLRHWQFARDLGVTPQYLSDVLANRRPAGPQLLKALGLRKRTIIEALA